MPATDKQLAHLNYLNSLPLVMAKRFQKGRIATNKVPRISVECNWCGELTQKKQFEINRSKLHFCSSECRALGKPSPITDRVVELYKSGMSLKDISVAMGHSIGTTASLIYKSKTGTRNGKGKTATKTKLSKACELCGYDRVVEVAHITPARKGGGYSFSNCLALCPNCHYLFDHGKLTETEQATLENIYALHQEGS